MDGMMLLLGVFLGGATPWLEAVVVIPGGILAGGQPVAVVIAGIVGNLLTVGLAVFFGERIRAWWRARRARQGRPVEDSERSRRAERLLNRYGLVALALAGPILTGTQVAAMLAVGLGAQRRATFLWISAGTIAWAMTAAVLTVTGSELVGS